MIQAAIVGLGWWGRVMVDAVRDSPKIRLTHGVVRGRHAHENFAASRGLVLHDSLSEVLADPSLDAVVLATPHSLHVPQILACAAAGKPVFSEKPLALTLAEARRAVDACERAGIVLGLGTDRRVLPAMKRLKALVDAEALGFMLHVEAQYSNDLMRQGFSGTWRTSVTEAPGAGMTGPGLHALDSMINIAGPLAKVSGQVSTPAEHAPMDTVSLMMAFTSGATGILGCVRGVPDCFRLAAYGTKGWAELRAFGDLHIHLSGAVPTVERYSPGLAVAELLECFAEAVTHASPFPVSTRAMLQTVAAFESAIRSLGTSGPVEVATP